MYRTPHNLDLGHTYRTVLDDHIAPQLEQSIFPHSGLP